MSVRKGTAAHGPQLTFDGREVPLTWAVARPPRLSMAQREILRHIRLTGQIRPFEAGRILHACRPNGCSFSGAKADGWSGGRGGCCPYGASDGSAALRRLAQRELVVRLDGASVLPEEVTG